jgi:hypothetical protein
MLTRSQTKVLEPHIDFDMASKEWNSNKKKMGNGCYVYICGVTLKNGNCCQTQENKCKKHGKKT